MPRGQAFSLNDTRTDVTLTLSSFCITVPGNDFHVALSLYLDGSEKKLLAPRRPGRQPPGKFVSAGPPRAMLRSPGAASIEARRFLRDHWQKKPLLVRGAFPECRDIATPAVLFELAARDDMESRLVERGRRGWRVRHGPFERGELKRLPRSGWTLLVQGINHAMPAAQRLLDAFAFIPYARLDDVMASYAPPGGGVGPHFDHYDVFLVQGAGRRRWRISRQRDLALVAGAPLRILRRFRAAREWILETGDVLYLPPRCAHDGVAIDDCITYSVGFRAPRAQELAAGFLDDLQERIRLPGIYEDPGLRPAAHPARLDDVMASYAPPGGGVGPHFDHYDVFLVQGAGRRRWRISRQRDLALVAGALRCARRLGFSSWRAAGRRKRIFRAAACRGAATRGVFFPSRRGTATAQHESHFPVR